MLRKKIIAIVIVFVMILNIYPVLATGNVSDMSNHILQVSKVNIINFKNNKDARIDLKVNNTSSTDKSAYLIAALYNEATNKMVTYNYVKANIKGGSSYEWGTCIPIPSQDHHIVKAFVWDNINNPTIISNVVKLYSKPNQKPVIVTNLTNKTVNEANFEFSVNITDDRDTNIIPEVILNNNIINPSNGKYNVVLSEGTNTIKIKAIDSDNDVTNQVYTIVYRNEATQTIQQKITVALNKTASYQVTEVDEPEVGFIGGEWTVMSLARMGYAVPTNYYEDYYDKVVKQANKEYIKTRRRWSDKVTEVERIALTLTAIGKDPRDVDGINLLKYIWDKEGNFPDIKPDGILGSRQGCNELIFALIALDTKNYEPIVSATITRDEIITKILNEYQLADGGFILSNYESNINIDITAMVLQALAPYYDSKTNVKQAVDNAITKLSQSQNSDGTYTYEFGGEETVSSETIAQVIVALSALDIDAHTDNRFVKNGHSLIDALFTFYKDNGAFEHVKGEEANAMATDQGMYALVAYDRLLKHKNRLYDMTDVNFGTEVQLAIQTNLTNKTVEQEAFDFTAIGKKGEEKITPVVKVNNVVVNGTGENYSSTLRAGSNTIKIEVVYKDIQKSQEYTVTYNPPSTGKVKLQIDRADGNGYIIPLKEVDISAGDSPYDVIKRELDNIGVGIEVRGFPDNMPTFTVIVSINDVQGTWCFYLNDELQGPPNGGIKEYQGLKVGDTIRISFFQN